MLSAHARAKYYQAWKQGKCEAANSFVDLIDELYDLELYYKEQGFTLELIKEGRKSARTVEIVADIRQKLTQFLNNGEDKSEQFQKALNYLNNFWTQLMAF